MKALTALLTALIVAPALADSYRHRDGYNSGYGDRGGSRYGRRDQCHWRNHRFRFVIYTPLRFDYTTQMTDYTQTCIDNWNSDTSKIRSLHNRISNNYGKMATNPASALVDFKRIGLENYNMKYRAWCNTWVSIPSGANIEMQNDFEQIKSIAKCGELVANYNLKLAAYNKKVDANDSESALASAAVALQSSVSSIVNSNDCIQDRNLNMEAFITELAELNAL